MSEREGEGDLRGRGRGGGGRGRGRGHSDESGGGHGFRGRGRGRGYGDNVGDGYGFRGRGRGHGPGDGTSRPDSQGFERGRGRGWGRGSGYRDQTSEGDVYNVEGVCSEQLMPPAAFIHGQEASRPPYRGRGWGRGWGQVGGASGLSSQGDGVRPTSPITESQALSPVAEVGHSIPESAALAAPPEIERPSTPSDAGPSGGRKGRSKKKRPKQASRAVDPSQQEKELSTPEVAGASVSPGTTTADSEAVTAEPAVAVTEEVSVTEDSRPTEIPSATGEGPSAKGKSRKKKSKAAGQPSSGLVVTSSTKIGTGFVGYQSLPHRPDAGGTIGEPVRISVNCWDITLKPMDIYVYFLEAISLDFVDSSGSRKELRLRAPDLRAKLRHVVEKMPPHTVYDGAHALYTDTPLPGITSDGITKELQLPDPMDAGSLFLKYRILSTQKISTQDLIAYLDNPKASTLNIPQVFKAFFTAGCMADVLYDKYGDNMMRCVRQMEDDVLRIRAQTNSLYKQKTNRVKRITVHGLSRKPATELIIPELNQSVASYFETKYEIRLKYPELPCVKSKKDKEEYLPMELLDILPFQAPKASKADVASQVIRLAAVQPRDRFKEIHSFLSVMLQ
ncbi:Protein argonaute-3, partial [Clonorchis sinensis]